MNYFVSFLLLLMLSTFLHQLVLAHGLSKGSEHDFSFMEVVYNATEMSIKEEYDFVIIGGGTTGCPLAATLSRKYSVLLLERGNVPQAYPSTLTISGGFTDLDENRTMVEQRIITEEGIETVASRVLGGSSMLFPGAYSRAPNEFFGSRWDKVLVREAYRWVGDRLVFYLDPPDWQLVVRDGLLEAGVVPDNGFNVGHNHGTKLTGMVFDKEGRRHGAVELLNEGNFKKLRVVVHATVERVTFSQYQPEETPKAMGVIYRDSLGKSHRALVRKKGEVILCAGAFGSPKLLLLSGIGPEPYLASLNITIIHPNPNVGKFIADNPRISAQIATPFPINPSRPQTLGISKNYTIQASSYPFSISPTPLPFSYFPRTANSGNLSLGIIHGVLSGPLSSGTLRLSSPEDADAVPVVRFNYFSDPTDLSHCVAVARKIGEMLGMRSLRRFEYQDLEGNRGFTYLGPPFPTGDSADDLSLESFCRNTFATLWHHHGGCLVGKVVDESYRVIGISSLRVVDSSTFTVSAGADQHATMMMLGR